MSVSRRRSPRAVNPEAEAPRPQNSNSLLSPRKMSWDTGMSQPAGSDSARDRLTSCSSPGRAAKPRTAEGPGCPASQTPAFRKPGDDACARRRSCAPARPPRSLSPAHLPSFEANRLSGTSGMFVGAGANCTAHARRDLSGAGSGQESSGIRVCGRPGE